jgi:hypothetical protein
MSALPLSQWPWPASWAPQWLNQSFNNGWTFGNIVVSTANSTAPDVERAVVSQYSYGRQIGRLMDAVVALSDRVPGAEVHPDVKPLLELSREVDEIKERAKQGRQAELLDELRALKRCDPQAWAELVRTVEG